MIRLFLAVFLLFPAFPAFASDCGKALELARVTLAEADFAAAAAACEKAGAAQWAEAQSGLGHAIYTQALASGSLARANEIITAHEAAVGQVLATEAPEIWVQSFGDLADVNRRLGNSAKAEAFDEILRDVFQPDTMPGEAALAAARLDRDAAIQTGPFAGATASDGRKAGDLISDGMDNDHKKLKYLARLMRAAAANEPDASVRRMIGDGADDLSQ